jgi:hypothetical protein
MIPAQRVLAERTVWFKVMLSAFLPMGTAFVLPRAAMIPMFVVTGIVLATGLVMVVIEERRGR